MFLCDMSGVLRVPLPAERRLEVVPAASSDSRSIASDNPSNGFPSHAQDELSTPKMIQIFEDNS